MGTRSRPDCPSDDALLRWSTGDLPARRSRPIQQHLETCAACAARLRGWDAAISVYKAYDAHAHAVPVPTADDAIARTQFAALLRREPRAASAWMPAPHLRWLHAAAALLLATACLLWLRPAQATLSAEALIAKAVDSEQQTPSPTVASRVTIAQTTSRSSVASHARTHATAGGGSGQATAVAAVHQTGSASEMTGTGTARNAETRAFVSERGADARELARRLEAYQFDWQFPLSAKPFQHWRASTPARADSLEWVDATLVRVSTSTAAGHVRRAELTIQMPDFRPVAQTWRFADGFEVELRMFDRTTPLSPRLAAAPPTTAADEGATASGATAAAPRTLDETELDLRGALEQSGVVLDRRVTIRRAGQVVVIDGRARAAVAQRIGAAARDLPSVEVRVRIGGIAPAPAAAATTTAAAAGVNATPSPGLRTWLDRTFGTSHLHRDFILQARELDARLQDAVATLADLARRYPEPVAARLSPASRRQLQRLAGAYFGRVTESYERLEAHLAPLTGTVSRRVLPAAAPPTWRDTPPALDADLRRLSADLAALATEPFENAEQVDTAARDRLRPALAAVAPR